jgi:hypothetical protein
MRTVARAVNSRGDTPVTSASTLTSTRIYAEIESASFRQHLTIKTCSAERQYRVLVRGQEPGRADLGIPQRVAGAEAGRLDLGVNARAGQRLGHVDGPGPEREAAAHRGQPKQVPGAELDRRAGRVDLVAAQLWSGLVEA